MSAIGQVLQGTYRLERVIGRGGMGTVFEASHLRLERRFAVKVLVREAAADGDALARFQREARVTSALGHPHIIEVVDFNLTEEEQPYLVMELLVGESLAERLERLRVLDLEAAMAIVRQATSALHAAHERAIVHRDLKPENIYLCQRQGRDDYVKLLDFGISKVVGAKTAVTRAQALVGSPSYMSPEQADERAAEVDARTDVYGVATLTFEMLAGAPPFVGKTIPSLLYKIVHQPPPSLCELRPELPVMLDHVLQRALAKDPDHRHQSMQELWEDLDEAARSAGVMAQPTRIEQSSWPSLPVQPAPSPSGRVPAIPEPGESEPGLLAFRPRPPSQPLAALPSEEQTVTQGPALQPMATEVEQDRDADDVWGPVTGPHREPSAGHPATAAGAAGGVGAMPFDATGASGVQAPLPGQAGSVTSLGGYSAPRWGDNAPPGASAPMPTIASAAPDGRSTLDQTGPRWNPPERPQDVGSFPSGEHGVFAGAPGMASAPLSPPPSHLVSAQAHPSHSTTLATSVGEMGREPAPSSSKLVGLIIAAAVFVVVGTVIGIVAFSSGRGAGRGTTVAASGSGDDPGSSVGASGVGSGARSKVAGSGSAGVAPGSGSAAAAPGSGSARPAVGSGSGSSAKGTATARGTASGSAATPQRGSGSGTSVSAGSGSARQPKRKRPRGFGRLRVGAVYKGQALWADVYVDRRHVGRTPLGITVRAGRHVVELRKGGRRVARRRVTVRANRKTWVGFTLNKL